MSQAYATSNAIPASSHTRPMTLFGVLLWVQGVYFALTGIWPLVSIETFQMVTGPKTDNAHTGLEADHWLVMTVGVLVTAVAIPMLVAAWRRTNVIEIAILAIGSSVGLTAIDVIYVARQTIPPIYLADAVIEVLLISAWIVALMREPRA
jgi:hypothetical protein